jgi:hypothetical protein
MGKIRATLKIALPTIVIGLSGASLGECANKGTYEITKYELKITKPSCKTAKNRVMKLKDNDEYILWKYWKGKYGEIEAYNDYILKKCD